MVEVIRRVHCWEAYVIADVTRIQGLVLCVGVFLYAFWWCIGWLIATESSFNRILVFLFAMSAWVLCSLELGNHADHGLIP
jgi:hypothetical protein